MQLTRPLAAVLAAVALAAPAASSHAQQRDLQIWLLETDDCGACALYRSFNNGAYPTGLAGHPAVDAPIPVKVVDKSDIPAPVAAQFEPHPYWSQSLSVMVLDGDRVLYMANIAEAADVGRARFPDAIMAPATAAERERAANAMHVYGEHFKATWKLDYFVDVALGQRAPHPSLAEVMLGQQDGLEGLGERNLILWGSAGTPSGNPLYIAERIQQIRGEVQSLGIADANTIVLYGNGDAAAPDTAVMIDGEVRHVRSEIDAPLSADAATLGRLFAGLRGSQRNLLVQVGHSGPVGAPLWGQLATLDAPLLEKLVDATGSDLVMVSGACNGGQFAGAPRCGFFAAHPQVVATGCQKSSEALRGSDDYLGLYFDGAGSGRADLDGNGAVSFIEAHWYAAVAAEHHQIPYDSTDVQVDAFWQAHGETLPPALDYAQLMQLADAVGTAEERWAVRQFAGRVDEGVGITTTDMLAINAAALEAVADMTEASSQERNAAMALDYPLVLSSLARRLLWRKHGDTGGQAADVAQCGDRPIAAFLDP